MPRRVSIGSSWMQECTTSHLASLDPLMRLKSASSRNFLCPAAPSARLVV
jgi:hypothetical protein